ncbi:MAG TPA: hypothetical protein PLU50_02965 [Pseudobdellovibrionaceae bacterium]|nr:hypothetical protein [Pseudobdellovibrionaceae bacterium]
MSIKFELLSAALGFSVIFSSISHADDPAHGSAAPGKLNCQLTYSLFDPSAPEQALPSCPTCTMIDPQHSFVTPSEFELSGSFTYIYGGAKQSSVAASDELVSFSGSAQINPDGYSRGVLNIRRGNQVIVNVMGAIVGTDLEVKLPVQGLFYKGKIVQQINASCFVK